MKKLLFLLMCIVGAMTGSAQDMIVKKDGSIIQAKVQRITSTDVKYKLYSNLNGPTLTISISQILAINYEDGEKETFGTETVPAQPAAKKDDADVMTKETATAFSKDKELLDIFYSKAVVSDYNKKAKRWKIAGCVTGVALIGTGVALMACADGDSYDQMLVSGIGIAGAGALTAVSCFCVGLRYNRKAKRDFMSASLWNSKFYFKNGNSLNVGMDAISCNATHTKTLGLGLRYNF